MAQPVPETRPDHLTSLRAWWAESLRREPLPWLSRDVSRDALDLLSLSQPILARVSTHEARERWTALFRGITSAQDLLRLPTPELERRCETATPGRSVYSSRALVSVAQALVHGEAHQADAVASRVYCGPYVGSMVALTQGATDTVPESSTLERVARQLGGSEDSRRWVGDAIKTSAMHLSITGAPPAYETVAALLYLGEVYCGEEPSCLLCPMRERCLI